jgi:hypothetical protein
MQLSDGENKYIAHDNVLTKKSDVIIIIIKIIIIIIINALFIEGYTVS